MRQSDPVLIFVSGLPGVGKSALASELASRLDSAVISRDAARLNLPASGIRRLVELLTWRLARALLSEGVELVQETLSRARLGPYQLQAAIAAVHAEALTAADTDWPQILELYDLLNALAPSPVVTLNRAVAVAMVDGPRAGLASLDALAGDRRLATHHRLASVRAHLQEMAGDTQAALAGYEEAARRTTSIPEQRYLRAQAQRLRSDVENPPAAPTVG